MIINKAILHILDFNSDVCVFSQRELDFSNDAIRIFIEKHLERIQLDSNRKHGTFNQQSSFVPILQNYLHGHSDIISFSTLLGNKLHEQILNSDRLDSTDFLVVDFSNENVRYIALLLLMNRVAYTHQVVNNSGKIYNELIRHYAILPSVSQKIESYAIVDCSTFSVDFLDKKRMIDGQDTFVLPDRLLECSSSISSKEAIKTINQIASKVAENHGVNSAIMISKAKNYLRENAEISSSFSPHELGKDVFADSEIMKSDFERHINEANLPSDIKITKSAAVRTGKNHKIKTDTGIEIIFPVEYFENHEYIEFVNNPDGTISIQLKNIGKIINK